MQNKFGNIMQTGNICRNFPTYQLPYCIKGALVTEICSHEGCFAFPVYKNSWTSQARFLLRKLRKASGLLLEKKVCWLSDLLPYYCNCHKAVMMMVLFFEVKCAIVTSWSRFNCILYVHFSLSVLFRTLMLDLRVISISTAVYWVIIFLCPTSIGVGIMHWWLLSVSPSVCPMHDPKSRLEGRRKPMTRVTREPI